MYYDDGKSSPLLDISSKQNDLGADFFAAVPGDVNSDGKLNISDVVLLQKWLLAVPDTHLADRKAADLCEDNRLDVFDLCLMKRELLTHDNNEE